MKRIAALAANALAACADLHPLRASEPDTSQDFAQIERGRYLTLVADCGACHTDPRRNKPFAGGRPIGTPFGTLLAPNITPDRETGIGAWTDEQFDTAVRRGEAPDGSRLYPAMPFPYYTRMSTDDVRAIRAYLNTVEPVNNPVHANQLPFPFSIRATMRFWDALYFKPGPFRPDPEKSAVWNRGAYLTEGPGHCAACHTPKTVLGGDKSRQPLQGYSLQGWFAPNITNDTTRGLSAWSNADIVDYLKKGHNQFAAASGPMGEEVADSSSKMTDGDLQAIAVYLKDRPGQSAASQAIRSDDPLMQAGAAIYKDICSACHKADGTGVPYLIPSLAVSPAVVASEPATLLQVVLRGSESVATNDEPTAPAMPAYGWQLSDVQVAAVTTYVRNSWNHHAAAVTENEVRQARKAMRAR